jgi:hypothetical protein
MLKINALINIISVLSIVIILLINISLLGLLRFLNILHSGLILKPAYYPRKPKRFSYSN